MMPRGKKRSPAKGKVPTLGDRGDRGVLGLDSSLGLPIVQGLRSATPPDQTKSISMEEQLQAKTSAVESRMSKVEAGMQTMASLLGGMQATLDRMEASSTPIDLGNVRLPLPGWLLEGLPPPHLPPGLQVQKEVKRRSLLIRRIFSPLM